MVGVQFSKNAEDDLFKITTEIHAAGGYTAAYDYATRFDALFSRLGDFPSLCANKPKLGASIRVCVVFPYLVIYAYEEQSSTLSILRIVHGRQRLSRSLLNQT